MQSVAVVVVGMHRSGTSAVMRVLNLLGVELGASLLPAHDSNTRGFWEHADLVRIHDHLLHALGTSWRDASPVPDRWWESQLVAPFRTQLIEVIQRDFGSTQIFGLKDPRICRILPLWNSIFDELNCRPVYVHVLRHPDEVSGSLRVRDGFSEARTRLLWLDHLLAAEEGSRGRARAFVLYEDLLSDWKACIRRISDLTGICWPREPSDAELAVSRFLEPGLRHHHATDEGAAKGWISSLYGSMTSIARNGETVPALQQVEGLRGSFEQGMHVFGSVLRELNTRTLHLERLAVDSKEELRATQELTRNQILGLRSRVAVLEPALTAARAQLELVTRERDILLRSRSWRITQPLRRIAGIVRKVSNGRASSEGD
jgi:hypothetical protein